MNDKYMVTIDDLKSITTREEVPELLNKMKANVICEVGVQFGGYLHILLASNIQKIVAVDCWKNTDNIGQNDSSYTQPQLDEQFYAVSGWTKVIPRLQVMRAFSVEAASNFDDGSFDFVYIDADHTEKAVSEDIQAWWPKVRSGGILAGHDYSPAIVSVNGQILKFGIIEAVNKFSATNQLPFHTDQNMSWYIPKT